MPTRVQFIRHSTAAANVFTGKEGEVTVDLDNDELRVHDEVKQGGHRVARQDMANVASATSSNDGKMTAAQVTELAAATTGLAAEIVRALAAEGVIAAGLAQELLDRVADVDAEETRALAAEGVLQTNITAEETTRYNDDVFLQNAINSEASTRGAADTTLQSNIDTEALTRATADALLIPLTQKAAANGVATLSAASYVVQKALTSFAADTATTAAACSGNSATATTLVGLLASIAELSNNASMTTGQTMSYGDWYVAEVFFSLVAGVGGTAEAIITHGLGTDDVDFGGKIKGGDIAGRDYTIGILSDPNDWAVRVEGPQAGAAAVARGTAPAAGQLRVKVYNAHATTQHIYVHVWVRRRT